MGLVPAMEEGPKVLHTGTTTLGIATEHAVVLATEKRATMGRLVGHMQTRKVFPIDQHMGMTTAGLVGDAQSLTRILQAEANLFRYRHGHGMRVSAAATLLGNLLHRRSRMAQYHVQLLIAGFDADGSGLYTVDAAGGTIPERWACTGSGSAFAFGVLEDRYAADVDADGAIDLAIRALNAAMRRDSASGNGMAIIVIDKDGYREVEESEIQNRHQAMALPISYNA